jgi:hypothetical protein
LIFGDNRRNARARANGGQRARIMLRSVLLGAASLALVVAASGSASAQTATTHPKHPNYHHAKHRKAKEAAAGRQITVHKATPSWLTLGPSASPDVGAGNNYVLDTFNQPTPIEGTFVGMRGREVLLLNRFNGPTVPLFRF